MTIPASVSLSEEKARLIAWRRSVNLAKKLIRLGFFHMTRPHLEALRHLERDVKPEPSGGRIPDWSHRPKRRMVKRRLMKWVALSVLALIAEIGVEAGQTAYHSWFDGAPGSGSEED